MEQKVIEIARGVAKTSTFTTKNEALRFAKSEGGAAIGIYENGGMYMFAFGAYKPQMVYSKLVYELKKAYNTGVHRTYTTDDGVFVSYMPLRKKIRRHGHGSPVPPPSTDIIFVGNENAALLGGESDLMWAEEHKAIAAIVFVKSTAYDKISEVVMEIDETQIEAVVITGSTISQVREQHPSMIIPQDFGDSDYYVSFAAYNVDDITEGDKAKVVLIDSGGEEFAQTNEKEIYIIPQPQTADIVFIGNENADLFKFESDLQWYEEMKTIAAVVFVKSTAYDKIAQAVIEVEGTQIITTEIEKSTISEVREQYPSTIVPQVFGDSDYFIAYTAPNVEDITEGDKAKVVLIDSEGEEFAQTIEKKIHIVISHDIYAAPTVDGETNPVAVEAGYNAYYAVRLSTHARTCKLIDEDMNEIELTPVQALSTITEQTVEAVPEFADYIGWYYDVVPITGAEAGKTYTLVYKADDEENDDLTLTIE